MKMVSAFASVLFLIACSEAPSTTIDHVSEPKASSATSALNDQFHTVAAQSDETVSGDGTLVEGVTCIRVRFDNGSIYSIHGSPIPPYKLRPGQRVRIVGESLAGSPCQQGPALNATTLEIL